MFYLTQSPQLPHVGDITIPILKIRKLKPRTLGYLAGLQSQKTAQLGFKYGPELNTHALSHSVTLLS